MWKFDKEVAARYDREVQTNIPHYNEVIDMCLDLAGTLGDQPHIIDCGCANGQTLHRFKRKGFNRLTGVDASSDMTSKVEDGITLLISKNFIPGRYDLILCNWMLHFITDPSERMRYIEEAYECLNPGGYMIISDKIDNEFLDQYHWWKRDQGLSQEEVDTKHQSLDGVLRPLPLRWYTQLFDSMRCEYNIINAHWTFNTFIIRKS